MKSQAAYDAAIVSMISAFRVFLLSGPLVEDAREAKRCIELAESVGSILDPTAFIRATQSPRGERGNSPLDRQRKVVDLYLRTRDELAELFGDEVELVEQLAALEEVANP